MSTFTCLYIFADRAYRTSRKRSRSRNRSSHNDEGCRVRDR